MRVVGGGWCRFRAQVVQRLAWEVCRLQTLLHIIKIKLHYCHRIWTTTTEWKRKSRDKGASPSQESPQIPLWGNVPWDPWSVKLINWVLYSSSSVGQTIVPSWDRFRFICQLRNRWKLTVAHSVNIRRQAFCRSVCRLGPVSDRGPLPPAEKSEKKFSWKVFGYMAKYTPTTSEPPMNTCTSRTPPQRLTE